jgi:hypothetical protein
LVVPENKESNIVHRDQYRYIGKTRNEGKRSRQTSDETSSSGGDETSLLTGDGVSGDGRGLSDMLVVTSSVRVVNGVHGNTSSSGPRVPLRLELRTQKDGNTNRGRQLMLSSSCASRKLLRRERKANLVESSTGLQQRLVDSTSSGNDTDGSSGRSRNGLLGSRRKTESGLVLVGGVSDDGSVVTRGSGNGSSVTDSLLDVADDGTLGALGEGKDVSDGERGLLSAVDKGAGGHALSSDEGLLSELVSVGVSEDDLGEGGSSEEGLKGVIWSGVRVCIGGGHRCGGGRAEKWVEQKRAADRSANCKSAILRSD